MQQTPLNGAATITPLPWSSVPQQQSLQQQQQQGGGGEVQRWYLDNSELEAFLRAYVDRCSHMARLYSIGRSVLGVPLWVLHITLNPTEKRPRFTFKYIGGVHGDEPLGRQLLLYLADWLCNNYPSHPLAREVVEGVELHLLPAMNPDGFTLHTRENANRVDLNRAFPDHWFAEMNAEEAGRQAEVRAVMRWTQRHHFSASASLHGPTTCGHASPSAAMHLLLLPCISLCCHASPSAAMHLPLLPCIALCCHASPCAAMHRLVLPCIALCCHASPCAAMHRLVLPSILSCSRFPVPCASIYRASPFYLLPHTPFPPPFRPQHCSIPISPSSHKPISPIPTPPIAPFPLPHNPPSPSPPRHQSSTHYAASPDDATFRLMATTYATAHPSMALSRDFPGGITNGASWYRAQGGVAGGGGGEGRGEGWGGRGQERERERERVGLVKRAVVVGEEGGGASSSPFPSSLHPYLPLLPFPPPASLLFCLSYALPCAPLPCVPLPCVPLPCVPLPCAPLPCALPLLCPPCHYPAWRAAASAVGGAPTGPARPPHHHCQGALLTLRCCVPFHAVPCHVMSCTMMLNIPARNTDDHFTPTMPCDFNLTPCHVMLRYVMPCHVLPSHVMPSHPMSSHAMPFSTSQPPSDPRFPLPAHTPARMPIALSATAPACPPVPLTMLPPTMLPPTMLPPTMLPSTTRQMGVQGTVLSAATSAPLPATIAVLGIDIQVTRSASACTPASLHAWVHGCMGAWVHGCMGA
ncbi:unnamed protein product, partial [Closterium sp. NIES-54]